MWQQCGHVVASICALSVGLLLTTASPAAAASRVAFANYAVVGGSTRESAQIEAALAASSFDWRVLPSIQVHVQPGVPARSTPGHVWLSSELLASGRFGWAVIQDEFAHQVDFFLLDDDERAILNAARRRLVVRRRERSAQPAGCRALHVHLRLGVLARTREQLPPALQA